MAYDPIKESANWFARSTGNGKGTSEYDDFVKKMQDLLNKPYDSVGPNKPDAPDYGQMGMDERSNDELSELAKKQLEEYKQQQQNAINNKTESESNALKESQDNADKILEDRQNQLEDSYSQARDSLNNDMLKRGLARSSIAVNTNTKLENNKLDAINQVQTQHDETLQKIQTQLSQLEAQRLQALDQFDIAFAAKLTTTINDLIQARDKANADAIKFNNNVQHQIQQDYGDQLSYAQKEQALNEAAQAKQKKEREEQFYNEARKVLANMTEKEAKDKLENDPIFKNIPQYMHTQLYREFVR